jgi:dihydrodipicolinate reductase
MVVPEAFRHGWVVAHHRIGHHPLGQVAQIRHCATARSRT